MNSPLNVDYELKEVSASIYRFLLFWNLVVKFWVSRLTFKTPFKCLVFYLYILEREILKEYTFKYLRREGTLCEGTK